MVQIAVGAAMTSLSDPAAPGAGFVWAWLAVADVTVSTSLLIGTIRPGPPGPLPPACQFAFTSSREVTEFPRPMDAAFADAVRDLLTSLASGTEPAVPPTGGFARVLRETGSTT